MSTAVTSASNDDDLGGALELAVRDIITAGIDRAEAEAMVWSTAEDRLDHVGNEPGGETALRVIDALQEWLLEDQPEHLWPACPNDLTHPMWIEPVDLDARWTCPRSGRRLAKLGELFTVT